MRFHVVSLPHTNTTEAFSACAYTEKVRKFCIMMHQLRGHDVYLYAGEQNEAPCTEHIPCLRESDRKVVEEKAGHYVYAPFDMTMPHWQAFNDAATRAIRARARPHDFICVIAGMCHQPIAAALPNHLTVEFGVGYTGVFAKFKVWESYAWMHANYGGWRNPAQADGSWFDAVIPGYLEMEKFPFNPKSRNGDYYLYLGRLTERKGYNIAIEVCRALGKRLILAGPGRAPDYGEYVGVVGPKERGQLLAGASALFVPTIYLEPFGNVAVEAMACGTPVISTDWGAMTETVIHGTTGYRCRMFREFCAATEDVLRLDPVAIHYHAAAHYSLPVVAQKYNDYFERLTTLWGKGWYAS